MPIDYNFDHTPGFRDVTHTSLILLRRPVVRSHSLLRRLRRGQVVPEFAVARHAKTFVGVR